MYASYITSVTILALCVFCSVRVFFLRYGRRDALSLVAFIALALAVANVALLGAGLVSVFAVVLTFVLSLTNFRALLRFGSDLLVDHYSIPFKVASVLILVVSTVALFVLVAFPPLFERVDSYSIENKTLKLSGSFSTGFHPSKIFEKSCAQLFITRPTVAMGTDATIVFLGDKRANRDNYLPLINALSKRGATVIFGEFFSKDTRYTLGAFDNKCLRRLVLRLESFFTGAKFDINKDFYSFNVARELEVLFTEAQKFEQKIFIVTDWMGDSAVKDFCAAHEKDEQLLGEFHFTNNEYAIQESFIMGFGLLRTTQPHLCFLKTLSEGSNFSQAFFATRAAIKTNKVADLADYIIEQTKNPSAKVE